MEINNLYDSVRQGKKRQLPLIYTWETRVKAGGFGYTFATSCDICPRSPPRCIRNQLNDTPTSTVFIILLACDWSKRVM